LLPYELRPQATSSPLDQTLRAALERRKLPAAVAMVATASEITAQCAYGAGVTPESIFYIASMVKPITSAAALQLVEQGKLQLDEPASRHLPVLEKLQILEGFEADTNKPLLRPARTPVTLRHLLTHTSGFAYDTWNATMFQYAKAAGTLGARLAAAPTPLLFEPGTRWDYGYSAEWVGRLVEHASGLPLEEYFQRHIFAPLSMNDTSFVLPAEKFPRLASRYTRPPGGSWKQEPRTLPPPPQAFNGGGALYSTAGDYVKFMQMILRRGAGTILQPATIEAMSANQIGDLNVAPLTSFQPERSGDLDFHPGFHDKFGFGFLLNPVAHKGGRSPGSLAWAGVLNTFFWIDPARDLCAVLMMQTSPFADPDALGLFADFERAVYAP
jgi:methyl acetate hydrolase